MRSRSSSSARSHADRGGSATPAMASSACAYAHAYATVLSPDTRPARRMPSASVMASKRFSMPLCTHPSRSSSRSTFSPTTWNRK